MTVVDNSGDVSDSPELAITPTANPADYYDNAGISDDSNTSCANYDGDGYSYSAQALSAAGLTPGGTVSADGLTFTWPNVASCANDNILAAGQTMLVSGTAGASKLGLLESSSERRELRLRSPSPTPTAHRQPRPLSSSDWANGPGTSETAVATMSYRNMSGGGSQAITMYVYATTVPIDSSKTVASVTFPECKQHGRFQHDSPCISSRLPPADARSDQAARRHHVGGRALLSVNLSRRPMERSRPTMKDVAIAARVSLKTVSRVVNGEPGVAPATEQRVREAIETLGFRRNDSARLLRTGQAATVGLVWRTSATRSTRRCCAAWKASREHAGRWCSAVPARRMPGPSASSPWRCAHAGSTGSSWSRPATTTVTCCPR